MQQNEPINESILSDAVRQDLKKERIDHMTYLPGMEVLDSDIGQQVLTRTSSYNYHCYTEADVRRAALPCCSSTFRGNCTGGSAGNSKALWQLGLYVYPLVHCQLL